MTEKQKRFCEEYLLDCNARQSALRAGYTKNTANSASRWLVSGSRHYKKELDLYVREQSKKMHDERIADAHEVMVNLTSILRGETKTQVIVPSSCVPVEIGTPTVDRLKAGELLGKHYGLFPNS